jgi:hypothetical protein
MQQDLPGMQQKEQALKQQMSALTPAQVAAGQGDALAAQHAALTKQIDQGHGDYAKAYEAHHGIPLSEARDMQTRAAQEATDAAAASKKPSLLSKLTVPGLMGAAAIGTGAYGAYRLADKGLDVLGREGRTSDTYGSPYGMAPSAINQYGMPTY